MPSVGTVCFLKQQDQETLQSLTFGAWAVDIGKTGTKFKIHQVTEHKRNTEEIVHSLNTSLVELVAGENSKRSEKLPSKLSIPHNHDLRPQHASVQSLQPVAPDSDQEQVPKHSRKRRRGRPPNLQLFLNNCNIFWMTSRKAEKTEKTLETKANLLIKSLDNFTATLRSQKEKQQKKSDTDTSDEDSDDDSDQTEDVIPQQASSMLMLVQPSMGPQYYQTVSVAIDPYLLQPQPVMQPVSYASPLSQLMHAPHAQLSYTTPLRLTHSHQPSMSPIKKRKKSKKKYFSKNAIDIGEGKVLEVKVIFFRILRYDLPFMVAPFMAA
eukprot:g30074.t1